MKKVFLTIAMVGLFAGTSLANSDPKKDTNSKKIAKASNVSITYETPQKIKLTVFDDDEGFIGLSVKDKSSGKTIANHMMSYEKSFALPIDMSTEKDGQYVISVKGEGFAMEQDVFLSSLHNEDVFASISEMENGQFKIKVLHDDVPVTVKILDENGRIYHKYLHTNKSNFERIFNLGDLTTQKDLYISISGNKSSIYKAL